MYERPGDMLIRLCSGAQALIVAAPYIKVGALAKVLKWIPFETQNFSKHRPTSNLGHKPKAKLQGFCRAEAIQNQNSWFHLGSTLDCISPTASLICITRWIPHDLVMGASDTECRTLVIERGGSFRLHPSLHAKYYRINNVVLVGSANLTSAAMGWSPHPNLEILCPPRDDFDADTFQRFLFEDAREISDEEFGHWESIAKINAEVKHSGTDAQPLLDTWRPATRDPRHLELVYRGREDSIASLDEQRAARRDIQALLIPSELTDKQVRAWVSVCLLAAPFTNTVIQLYDMEAAEAARLLAETYDLGLTEARRDMETVQNWIAFLNLEFLSL